MKNSHQALAIAAAIIIALPFMAAAQTVTASSTVGAQVQALLSQINALEQQLHSLIQSVASTSAPQMWNASSTPPNSSVGPAVSGMGGCPSFSRNLSVGSQGSDVTQLQQMLQGDGFLNASTTGYFGTLTANALDQFQMHFGISTSSSGFFGQLTRAFIGSHCGQSGQGKQSGQGMGSSTPPMWQGSTTPSVPPMIPWNGTSTKPNWQGGQQPGSSTPPMRPCPQDSPNADQGAAAAFFIPHAILPAFFGNPCGQAISTQQ